MVDTDTMADVEGLLEDAPDIAATSAHTRASERGWRPLGLGGILMACLLGAALVISFSRTFPRRPTLTGDSDVNLMNAIVVTPQPAVISATTVPAAAETLPPVATFPPAGATTTPPAATLPLIASAAVATTLPPAAGVPDPAALGVTAVDAAAAACSPHGADCSETKCCSEANTQCFKKDDFWATCMDSCEPGLHLSEPKKIQTPWECTVLHPPTPAPAAVPAVVIPCQPTLSSTCPGEWATGPVGGYMCLDEGGGCSSWEAGPFPWSACKAQCSLGNIPTSSTVTTTSFTVTTTTVTKTYPGCDLKLFCWSLARIAPGDEMLTIKYQLEHYAGIFACDDTAVLSFGAYTVGTWKGKPFKVIEVGTAPVVTSKDGTAGNALQFMKAWDAIRDDPDGTYKRNDWTIKADPDAVLLPDRMRIHLNAHRGANAYVRNCDKPMSEGNMMFGSMEVISRTAIETFFANTLSCYNEVPWQAWGEDLYLMRCMEHLGVAWIDDYQMVQDGVCKGVWCGDSYAAAFHPMKSVGAWEQCWNTAIAAR